MGNSGSEMNARGRSMTFFANALHCQILSCASLPSGSNLLRRSAVPLLFALALVNIQLPGFCIPDTENYSPVKTQEFQKLVNPTSKSHTDDKWGKDNGQKTFQGSPTEPLGQGAATQASNEGQDQAEKQEPQTCKSCGEQSSAGHVNPQGMYAWSGQSIGGAKAGVCPNPTYSQPPCNQPPQCQSGTCAAQITQAQQTMNGLPISNDQAAALIPQIAHAFASNMLDTQNSVPAMKAMQQAQQQQGADNQGQSCQNNCQTSFQVMMIDLINVANESAGIPTLANVQYKTLPQAVWMVQRMYKHCYVPMAILFILPGAILTQLKSLIHFQILGGQCEDSISPFSGIFRSIMAIFLIPCTQLIVSYCIDIGNSLSFTVRNYVVLELLQSWVEDQAYTTRPRNIDNFLKGIPGGAKDQGKIGNMDDDKTVQERQGNLTSSVQNFLNTVNNFVSQGLTVLNAFQIVMICYLFLLGPIAAAFYAWPSGIGRDIFKKTFSNWMDGVVVLCLWKFWWCIVLLCMVVRLQSGAIQPQNQFEMYYFTAFMGILVFVPFQPFDFRPGEIISQVLEKAQQASGGGGGSGGGGSGGGSGGGGSNTAGSKGGQAGGGTTNNSTMQQSRGQVGTVDTQAGQTSSVGGRGGGSGEQGSSQGSVSSNTSSPSAGPVEGQVRPKGLVKPPSSEKDKGSKQEKSSGGNQGRSGPPTA